MSTLRTDAWLLLGISSIPGELSLKDEILAFTAYNTGSAWPWQLRRLERLLSAPGVSESIDAGKRTVLFKWSVHEVSAWCPWYYFGGGLKIRNSSLTLRFSLGKPANMRIRGDRTNPSVALLEAADELKEISRMRSRGRLWLAALQQSAPGKKRDT